MESTELERLKSREPQYLETLFREVNPYLSRVLVSQGIYDESREELLHQTWEQFFTKLELFEGRSQVRTFVCGILINKIREHRRATKRLVLEEDPEKIMNQAFTEDGWWKSEPPDPEALLDAKQIDQFVQDCLEGLSSQQRAAFVLREVEQEESVDICNILAVSASNLRVLLFRAKEKLRMCVEGRL